MPVIEPTATDMSNTLKVLNLHKAGICDSIGHILNNINVCKFGKLTNAFKLNSANKHAVKSKYDKCFKWL